MVNEFGMVLADTSSVNANIESNKVRKATVLNARYTANSGRAPKGFGMWGFSPDWNVDVCAKDADIFWHKGTYTEAKRAAALHYGAKGIDTVETLP